MVLLSSNFKFVLGWSEAWAMVIPIVLLLQNPKQPGYMKPVIWYVWIAFVLNLFQCTIANLKNDLNFPHWLQTNNYVYNINSIVRFTCFALFFFGLRQVYAARLKVWILVLFYLFVLINFLFFEDFFHFNHLSSRLLTTEAYLLMIYCLLYFFAKMKQYDTSKIRTPDFWVATGLMMYVSVNFFIFLFQNQLVKELKPLAISIWRVHDVVFIIFCIILAIAFKGRKNMQSAYYMPQNQS